MGNVLAMILLAIVVAVVVVRVVRHVYGDAGREWRFVYRPEE